MEKCGEEKTERGERLTTYWAFGQRHAGSLLGAETGSSAFPRNWSGPIAQQSVIPSLNTELRKMNEDDYDDVFFRHSALRLGVVLFRAIGEVEGMLCQRREGNSFVLFSLGLWPVLILRCLV